MGLRKQAIEWDDESAALEAASAEVAPSPALLLQQMLSERATVLTRPELTADQLRKLLMMLAAAGTALWMALIMTTSSAVALVA